MVLFTGKTCPPITGLVTLVTEDLNKCEIFNFCCIQEKRIFHPCGKASSRGF